MTRYLDFIIISLPFRFNLNHKVAIFDSLDLVEADPSDAIVTECIIKKSRIGKLIQCVRIRETAMSILLKIQFLIVQILYFTSIPHVSPVGLVPPTRVRKINNVAALNVWIFCQNTLRPEITHIVSDRFG